MSSPFRVKISLAITAMVLLLDVVRVERVSPRRGFPNGMMTRRSRSELSA